jgi:hypothetical protein
VIYLIRHATPLIDYQPCNARSAKLLLDEYNQTSSIDEAEIAAFLSQPDVSQVLLASEANILSSPVNRAYATACRLFDVARIRQDARLREYDLLLSSIPVLRMGLRHWSRCTGFCGCWGFHWGPRPEKPNTNGRLVWPMSFTTAAMSQGRSQSLSPTACSSEPSGKPCKSAACRRAGYIGRGVLPSSR